ncbi:hypothetical protein Tco_1494751 [Tanacetum coccineum]
MTDAQIKALIAQGVAEALAELDRDRSRNGDDSHDSGSDRRRRMPFARECTYSDFLKCQPLNYKGTEGVVRLTQWFERMESVFHISNCAVENQVKYATCTLLGNALTWWNSHVKTVGHDAAYGMPWKTLMKIRMFLEESDKVKKYVGGLSDMIQGSVMASKPKKMQDAIEFATELMDQKICTLAERQAKNKRKFKDTLRNNQNQQQPFKRHNVTWAYTARPGALQERLPKVEKQESGKSSWECADRSFVSTAFSYLINIVPTTLDHGYDVELADGKIIKLTKYHAVIVCDEKLVRVPFGNEVLIFRGDGSNNGHESRLNIISCTKTQKYFLKGCQVFLTHITTKKAEDKSEEKRLEDVPIV